MSSYPVQWCGGVVPSHLTQAQVARLFGISPAAVASRCQRNLAVVDVLGTKMIAVVDLAAQGLLTLPK
jgi:hypothetical protein